MGDFRQACDFVLHNEDPEMTGKVVPDPTSDDPKAVARFGVNSARHPEAVREGFFEMKTAAALQYAEDVFKYDYFNRIGGYQIVNQSIANKFADLAFNEGPEEATKIVQRAVNILLLAGERPLDVDGKTGPHTMVLINGLVPAQLLSAVKMEATAFYKLIASRDPAKEKYLAGWLRRVEA